MMVYILDTNILLDSPNAIFGFADNEVVITGTTMQELDSKKTLHDEIGYNARETCRILESLRSKGANFQKGVTLDTGGILKIVANGVSEENMPRGYSLTNPDNRIISATKTIAESQPKKKTILVTNDISMRINASICGINVESYRNDHIVSDETYTGRTTIEVAENVIDALYKNNEISDAVCQDKNYVKWFNSLIENEFIVLKAGQKSALGIYRNNKIIRIDDKLLRPFGISPKNVAQKFALYALLAPVDEIPFVILKGSAGTAKTFLSLAAGLAQTYDRKRDRTYDKVLISRNNVMSDADFGYLPGDLDEKMTPLLAPFYDNLESLLRAKVKEEDNTQIQIQIEDMFMTKVIDICPLAYMRGRSICNSYLIVDETQNASRSQIRDIITRAGQGTKIIICGDPEQIDARNLDKWNNGLTFASEKMKGSSLCAQITFADEESVRSKLAKEAISRLEL